MREKVRGEISVAISIADQDGTETTTVDYLTYLMEA